MSGSIGRVLTTGEPVTQSLPADPASVRTARDLARDVARERGATRRQMENVRLATSEAVTNVVLHAYAESAIGQVHLRISCEDDSLWVSVSDDGLGFRVRPDSPGLGMGLIVIANATTEMDIVTRPTGGTEVRMRFPLG